MSLGRSAERAALSLGRRAERAAAALGRRAERAAPSLGRSAERAVWRWGVARGPRRGAASRGGDAPPPARVRRAAVRTRRGPDADVGSTRRRGGGDCYDSPDMPRRLTQRDYLLLSLVTVALVLLAIQLPFGTRGFDRPQAGAHWKVLEAPGHALGWGGIAILVLVIPYALVAWLKGRLPGRAVSALGALVFGVGVGGLAGLLAATPVRGGGVAGGALAHMLADSLGAGFAYAILAAIAIPGLFLSLAPLLLETGYVVKSTMPASAGPASAASAATAAGAAPATGAGPLQRGKPGGLPPVLVKPWYPERRVGEDGEELPMALPGGDVGPIRYRDPPPPAVSGASPTTDASSAATAQRPASKPIPKAEAPPAPTLVAGRKPPVITGVRYRDEVPEPPPPPPADPRFRRPDAEEELADGVRFAPGEAQQPPVEIVPRAPAESPVEPPPPPAPVVVIAVPAEPAPVEVAPPVASEPPAATAPVADADPAPVPAPPAAEAEPSLGASTAPQNPSVAGHRRKLAESGIFDGTSPAADRPGRPPKPKPRPSPPRDWKEALHGLFSSLPVEELPPIRVPDDLVGPTAEETAAAEAALHADTPGQMKLFDAGSVEPDGRAPGTRDALFEASVDAALERGTASLVLLKRKLGVGYARAASLMDALVAEGVLGEMTASGSRPTLLTVAEWNRRKRDRA